MVAFIKSTYNKTWKDVTKGWKHHVITSQNGTSTLKSEVDWINAENHEALRNSKALNFIFNVVDKNIFRLINTCVEAKEAWKILKIAHECTYKVRMSRMQLLTIKFENLIMNEDESISEFNTRLCYIVNTSFSL